jgi:hypothetical protein
MSTPADRSGPDEPEDGAWHEPAHPGSGADPTTPGGPLLPTEQGPPRRRGGGWYWRPRGDVAEVFTYQGDLVGAQGWALQHGWSISDGTGQQDAVLADLVASAPVRASREHRPAGVLRGRAGNLELVAFDVVYPLRGRWLAQWAVTAAPLLAAVPAFRLSPARLWKHRTTGMSPLISGNEAFDARWLLLATEDAPELRRLVQDQAVQGLLLGSDDGDEFWSGAGHLAAIRPDGHRPSLIEHHARLLTAAVGALTGGYQD